MEKLDFCMRSTKKKKLVWRVGDGSDEQC
jgi:hypothetical protein